jgi:hypothetical protein
VDFEEYADLFQYLRSVVRAIGRADLDERILESQRLYAARGDAEDVESYLRAFRTEMVLGSEETEREVMRRFRSVQTTTGRPISGIVIDVQEEDRATYRRDRIDLIGSAELDELIRELDELLVHLGEERRNG